MEDLTFEDILKIGGKEANKLLYKIIKKEIERKNRVNYWQRTGRLQHLIKNKRGGNEND